jgi:outer membrane protein assembly factor BamB
MRRLGLALGILAIAGLVGFLLFGQLSGREVRGASTGNARPSPRIQTRPHAPTRRLSSAEPLPWPTYGFDVARTHSPEGFAHQPPFRRLWSAFTDSSFIEFPPVVAYGRLYVGTNYGLVIAVDARTGKSVWRRYLGRCIAASPTVGRGVVYIATMDPAPCEGHDAGAGGYLVALNALTGERMWSYRTGLIESSPLLVDGTVYFGSWDNRVYAVDAKTHLPRWTFATQGPVKAGPAYANGIVYIGSYDGRVYALDARTGKVHWSAAAQTRRGRRGNFYATPAIARGHVYVGATDGNVYAFDAGTGRLLWSYSTGNYVYAPAAVWRGTVYVGSYDHRLYALNAATGAVRWMFDAHHPISGAPTVLGGFVYFSTCGGCWSRELDRRARRTFGVDTATGRLAWTFPDGEYSPIVADRSRAYLTGLTNLYALVPRRTAQPARSTAGAPAAPAVRCVVC